MGEPTNNSDLFQLSTTHNDRFTICPSINELIANNFNWETVKIHLNNEFRFFEPLLFKLHFRRKTSYTHSELKNILLFLNLAYHFSADIRYLNEFLWFYPSHSDFEYLLENIVYRFRTNLDENNYHSFPLASSTEITAYLNKSKDKIDNANKKLPKPINLLKIAFLGIPTQFKKSYTFFKKKKLGQNQYSSLNTRIK